MLNTEKYYLSLISIEKGQRFDLMKQELYLKAFTEDWLNDKSRIWSATLEELIEKTKKVLELINQSINYQFASNSEIEAENLISKLDPGIKGKYPKRASIMFEEIILRNPLEEVHLNRKLHAEDLQNSLTLQLQELESCLKFYEDEKDSKIFCPEYPKKDRIPYQGGERSLAFFIALLIEGGFILGPPITNDYQKGGASQTYINESIKKYIISKDQLSSAVSKSFYCVNKIGEKSSEGSIIQDPKITNLKSKMQVTTLKDLADTEKQRIQNGLTKMLNYVDANS